MILTNIKNSIKNNFDIVPGTCHSLREHFNHLCARMLFAQVKNSTKIFLLAIFIYRSNFISRRQFTEIIGILSIMTGSHERLDLVFHNIL